MKNMRKLLLLFAAVMMAVAFVSCEGRNDPDEEERKAVAVHIEGTITVSDDMLELLEPYVQYYDGPFEYWITSVTMTTNEFTLIQKDAPLTRPRGMCLRLKLKDSINIENYEQVEIKAYCRYNCYAVDQNGDVVGRVHQKDDFGVSATLPGDILKESWVEKFNEKAPVCFLYIFDEDGNGDEMSSNWQRVPWN